MTAPPRVYGNLEAFLRQPAALRFAQLSLLLAVSLAIASLAIYAAASTNLAYYERNPFLGDTASYFLLQQQIWFDSQALGKFTAIWRDFLDNPRNPGLTLSYLFLPPYQLLTVNGHLFYTGIAFASLVATFVVCVWRRTGSLAWACAVSVLPLVAEGFFNPIYQVPSKLPDPPAAFFAGAALFSLLNSSGARQPVWLVLFGIFASFAALSRFIAAGYVLIICGPVLAAYLLNLWRKEPEWKRYVRRALLCIAAPIVLLAGTFLWKHGVGNFLFYAHAGYGLNQTLAAALDLTLGKFAALFLGPLGIATLAILSVVAIAERGPPRLLGMWDSIWVASSHIVLIVFALRVADDSPQLIFAYPGLLLLAAAPFTKRAARARVLSGGAALVLGISLAGVAWMQWSRATSEFSHSVTAAKSMIRALNHDLAEHIAAWPMRDNRPAAMDSAFTYYGRYVAATAVLDFNRVISYRNRFFDIRESQWTLGRPDVDRKTLFARAAANIDSFIDFLIVLDEPGAPEARDVLYDDYTIAMAEDLNAHIAAHPQRWTAMKRFNSPWGSVTLYRNRERT